MTTSLVPWDAPDGKRLLFGVHLRYANWPSIGGLYLFCKLEPPSTWVPLYIGQATILDERLCSHERWDEAQRLGATRVLAATVPLQADRDRYEKALIEQFDPCLNVKLRPLIGNLGLGALPKQPPFFETLKFGAGVRLK